MVTLEADRLKKGLTYSGLNRGMIPNKPRSEIRLLENDFAKHEVNCSESTGSNTFVFLGYRNPYSSVFLGPVVSWLWSFLVFRAGNRFLKSPRRQ